MANCNDSQREYKWCLQEVSSHKVWPVAQIAELHHARYLLQPRALELFLYNHSSALLSFETPKVSCQSSHCDHSNVIITFSAVLTILLGVIDMVLMMRAYCQLPASTLSNCSLLC